MCVSRHICGNTCRNQNMLLTLKAPVSDYMLIWVYLCDYKNASFFRRVNRCINIYINLLKDAKENWLDRGKILHLTVGGMLHQGECWTSTCNGIKSDLWESLEAWEIMLWDFRQFQHFVGVAFLWLIHACITFPPEILLPVTFPHLVYVSCFFFFFFFFFF